jgi:hypothetical protein
LSDNTQGPPELVALRYTNIFKRRLDAQRDAIARIFAFSEQSELENAALRGRVAILEAQLSNATESLRHAEMAAGYNSDVADIALHDWSRKITREMAARIAKDALTGLIGEHCGCTPLDSLDYAHVDRAFGI